MPRMGGPRVPEKSKDFSGSMKRLLNNLKKWKYAMIIAIFLGFVSAILSLIAPNKLSDFADEIGKGLVPKTDKFQVISEEIVKNINEDKMSNLMTSTTIPKSDLKSFKEISMKLKNAKEEEKMSLFLQMPESVLNSMLEDIKVDGIKVSIADQIEMIKLVSNKQKESGTEESLKAMDKLPKSVYKIIEPKMNGEKIKSIVIVIAIIYICSSLFGFIQNFTMTTVSNRFAMKLRTSISNKINKLPLKYFDLHESGDILSRVTNDIDTISQNLNNSLATLVGSLTLFIGSIIMMFVTNWIIALTAIVSCIFGFVFMGLILGKSQKYFARSQKALGDLNGYIEEIYSGHNVVKAYNGSKEAIEKFEVLNNELYEAKRKSIFLSGTMQPMMGFIGNFGYVAVCIVGALLTMNGYISFGVIVAFMIYIRLFTNPLSQIAQAMTSLQSTAAASERVFEFLDEKEMTDESLFTEELSNKDAKGTIEFKNVKFGYDDSRIIIKDFSVKANPGEKIAIVGPTGAGKTTMVNLLMKFYEINDGDILIDNVSIKKLTRENIHKLFIMVLQDTWLFDGTIRENLMFNKKNVTEEKLNEACRVVGVDHFIKTLPGGLDSKISDSDTISQGQKQLLTIARGMIEDAPFLILDEATSNVDTRTEELVQKAMDKLTKGRTSFIIAHRLSTIKNADLILVMKDGNIVEQGNHEELLSKGGFYAELYNSQFDTINE